MIVMVNHVDRGARVSGPAAPPASRVGAESPSSVAGSHGRNETMTIVRRTGPFSDPVSPRKAMGRQPSDGR